MNNNQTNQEKTNQELIKQANSVMPLSSISVLISALLIAALFWKISYQLDTIIWLVALSVILIVRNINAYKYNIIHLNTPLKKDIFYFQSLAIITAIIMSVGVVNNFVEHKPLYQAFLIMVMAGLSAGAVMSLSFYRNLTIVYLAILLLPITYVTYLEHTVVHTYISGLMLLFFIMLSLFAKKSNSNILHIINAQQALEVSDKTIYYQTFYDELTGLPNKVNLNEYLTNQLPRLKREHHFGAVLMIDIDNFKDINDALGHKIGDEFLKIFAHRVQDILRQEDTFARLGGDEFVIFLSDIAINEEEAIKISNEVAQKLHLSCLEPIQIKENYLDITLSIGIKLIGEKDDTIENVLKNADIAMYRAKQQGKNLTCFFEQSMSDRAKEQLQLAKELKVAVSNKQLKLYFQPIAYTKDKKITSCEALIRWNHPQRGTIFPDDFIPFAETNNLIIEIGDWVINEACQSYQQLKGTIDTIAINISPKQFSQDDFVDKLVLTTQNHHVEPTALKLELTESVAMENLEDTIEKMNLLKSFGFTFAMDDFGTGYSSLSYLKNLPFDFLKIDRSFIMNIQSNKEDKKLVKTLILMAKQFGFEVIAEGVESHYHVEILKELECEYIQGYYLSKAIPIEEFKKLL